MANTKTKTDVTWDFILEHYPNYYSSDEILSNDIMTRIIGAGDIESVPDDDEAALEMITAVRNELAKNECGGFGCDPLGISDDEVFTEINRALLESTVALYKTAVRHAAEKAKAEKAKARKIVVVCPECGSDDVACDATARWNVGNQEWELSGTFDEKTCQQCEYENDSFSEKDLNTGETTPEDGIAAEFLARIDGVRRG